MNTMAFIMMNPLILLVNTCLFLVIPQKECVPTNVDLRTPLVKFKKVKNQRYYIEYSLVSAIMQSVSDDKMAIALSKRWYILYLWFPDY